MIYASKPVGPAASQQHSNRARIINHRQGVKKAAVLTPRGPKMCCEWEAYLVADEEPVDQEDPEVNS